MRNLTILVICRQGTVNKPGKLDEEAGCMSKYHPDQVHCPPNKWLPCHQVRPQHFYPSNYNRCWWCHPWTTAAMQQEKTDTQHKVQPQSVSEQTLSEGITKSKAKVTNKSKGKNKIQTGQWKQINYLNLDIPFPYIKIFITYFTTPFLFPIKLFRNLRPEPCRVLNGSLVHLQILMDHKSQTH